ncbi:hypothetical protein ACRJ4B_11775 [Streptomyces sp. GTA36]
MAELRGYHHASGRTAKDQEDTQQQVRQATAPRHTPHPSRLLVIATTSPPTSRRSTSLNLKI